MIYNSLQYGNDVISIAEKEAIRQSIIAKGVAVPVDTALAVYPTKIEAITTSDGPIFFADAAVKTICVTNWGSGGEITTTQAAAVTSAQFGETFRGLTTITSFGELSFFTGLTSIPANAFRDCTQLSGVLNIPANVVTIGAYAFSGCLFTGALLFPASVTTINDHAFYNCSGFYSLIIPNTVTSLASGGYQFYGWNLSLGTGLRGTLAIGTGITDIPQYCFYGCRFTGTLTISANITNIGAYAFYYNDCFTGNLVIPDTITSIGVYAFHNCIRMTGTLTIGTGITAIPQNCFYGCKFTGTLTIPANITNIGQGAFSGNSGFTDNLVIPDTVTELPDNGQQFYGCTGMTGSLTIGTGITHIPASCFSGCRFTGNVTIPTGVNYIGALAFNATTTVTSITVQATTPPTLLSSVFSGTFPLYVPAASEAAYEAATNWIAYAARIFGY